MSVIEHSDDDWTPPTGPWTEADHWRWTANHHREFRVRAEEDRARLTERLEGAVATATDAISLAEHLVPYAPQHERARFFAETAELRKLSIGAVRERDTALVDRVRLVGEVERLRLQVAALESDGMELAAKLGEAEEQIARLTARGGS
jgi:hypothetical protein